MTCSKGSTGIDHRPLEGEPLAFVDRDGPGQAYRILGKRTQFLFVDLVVLFIVDITDVLPGFFFQHQLLTVINKRNCDLTIEYARYRSEFSIEKPALRTAVVLDEHDLGTCF